MSPLLADKNSRFHRHRLKVIASYLCVLASPVWAADDNPWSGDIEFGYMATSGNTQTKTVNTLVDVSWESELWKNNSNFNSLDIEEDGDRTADEYSISNQLDYKLNENSYIFGLISYNKDYFDGFDWRATTATGYGYLLLNDTDNMSLAIEASPGYRVSKIRDDAMDEDQNAMDEDQDEVILRVYAAYEWEISDSSTFEQTLSVESGDQNTISESTTSLKITIIEQFSFKLSYTMEYTEEVPVSNEHTDTDTTATLVYSF